MSDEKDKADQQGLGPPAARSLCDVCGREKRTHALPADVLRYTCYREYLGDIRPKAAAEECYRLGYEREKAAGGAAEEGHALYRARYFEKAAESQQWAAKAGAAAAALAEERRRALREALDEVRAEQDQWLNVPAFAYIVKRLTSLIEGAATPKEAPSSSVSEALTGKEGLDGAPTRGEAEPGGTLAGLRKARDVYVSSEGDDYLLMKLLQAVDKTLEQPRAAPVKDPSDSAPLEGLKDLGAAAQGPQPCTGSGWPAVDRQGTWMSTITPVDGQCGMCGQRVRIDSDGRCVTHPPAPQAPSASAVPATQMGAAALRLPQPLPDDDSRYGETVEDARRGAYLRAARIARSCCGCPTDAIARCEAEIAADRIAELAKDPVTQEVEDDIAF